MNPQRSTDEIREQAVNWLLRLQSDKCSNQDRDEFQLWLVQHPLHRELYNEAEQACQWVSSFNTKPLPARQAALRYRPKPKAGIQRITAAASVLLMTATALAAWQWLMPSTYRVATGGRESIRLADGSQMELNTNTIAKVRINPWQRQVELVQGEAYFNVAHETARAFEVQAGSGIIRDLGTAFEVYKTKGKVLVAVEEGNVTVSTRQTKQLAAGQQIAYDGDGEFLNLAPQPIGRMTAWRQGQIVFHDQRLDAVLAEIARYHDKDIRLANTKLAALRVSGAFPVNNLDNMLASVARVLHIRMERQGDAILLTGSANAAP